MKQIKGGVTAPLGYRATGGEAGIKNGIKDMALLVSDVPAEAAGAFTTNVVKAASVVRNMEIMEKKQKIKGIVVNSGNANACTGEDGVSANEEMAQTLAKCLDVSGDAILTASTGVIGVPFPIEKVKNGIFKLISKLGNTLEDGLLAAQGIMTTDTYSKEVAVEFTLGGKTVRMGGMAKGSGMIHPNMATMLGFITTDAAIDRALLEKALKEDVKTTYNMVSVDGDTSTNDTVIVLANGMANNLMIQTENEDYETFCKALHFVNEVLAKQLVRDGEGATKFIEISVTGAATEEDAKTIAKSVVTSSLVKTAMFGEDANWGRILCAMGYSGIQFNPNMVDIVFESAAGSILLMEKGTPIVFDEEKAATILHEKEITVQITLQEGNASAKAWGCDLSYEYVKINGEYRS